MPAILLIKEMPKNCKECPCCLCLICAPSNEDVDEYINPSEGRLDFCPLKELPQKKEIELPWLYAEYENGWNDCIDEITGETE